MWWWWTAALAADLSVCQSPSVCPTGAFTDISSALASSTDGDRIWVWPGDWSSPESLPEGRSLLSKRGPTLTRLVAEARPPLTPMLSLSSRTLLDGFALVPDPSIAAALATTASDVVIRDVRISGVSRPETDGPALRVGVNARVTLEDSVISGVTGQMGAVWVGPYAVLSVVRSRFVANRACSGGALYSVGLGLDLDEVAFVNNTADPEVCVDGSVFQDGFGGALVTQGAGVAVPAWVTLRGVSFVRNGAESYGAWWAHGVADVDVQDALFLGNTAVSQGGAVGWMPENDEHFFASGARWVGNAASGYGPSALAITAWDVTGASIEVERSAFWGHPTTDGGVVFASETPLRIEDSLACENSGSVSFLAARNSHVTLRGLLIGGTVGAGLGLISVYDEPTRPSGSLTLDRVTAAGNTFETWTPAGVYASNAWVAVQDAWISGPSSGGGLVVSRFTEAVLDRALFTGNRGALRYNSADEQINDTTVVQSAEGLAGLPNLEADACRGDWPGDMGEPGFLVDFDAARAALFADSDGDGFNALLDCDDLDPGVSPGAVEVCDAENVDEDCNGLVDDADPDVATSGLALVYPDLDGDGYGVAAELHLACDPPRGWSIDGGDCDDTDPDIAPGVDDAPLDGIDADCDGLDGEGDTDTGPVDTDTDPVEESWWLVGGGCDHGGGGPSPAWALAVIAALYRVPRRLRSS